MEKTSTSERLKEIMLEKNLKQVDILKRAEPFCKKYGIKLGRNDLSQYVSGKVEPSQKKLTVLAQALDINEVWLMGYDISDSDEIVDANWNEIMVNAKNYENFEEELIKNPDLVKEMDLDYQYCPSTETEIDFGLEVYANDMVLYRELINRNIIIHTKPLTPVQLKEIIIYIRNNKDELKKIINIEMKKNQERWNDFLHSLRYKDYVKELENR